MDGGNFIYLHAYHGCLSFGDRRYGSLTLRLTERFGSFPSVLDSLQYSYYYAVDSKNGMDSLEYGGGLNRPGQQKAAANPGLSQNVGSGVTPPYMKLNNKKTKRKLMSSTAEPPSGEMLRSPPDYTIGLGSDTDWPKVEGDDDFNFAVLNPGSYSSIQKYCDTPREYFDLNQGCNCSGEHACLEFREKRVVATTTESFSIETPFFSTTTGDWCGQNNPNQVSGCICEWRNTCDFVIYSSLRMSLSCVACP